MSKPPRSSLSNFFHDLVTVDFHQTDINTGVRLAILLIIVTVLGLITGHAAEASFVWLGAAYVLAVDQLRSKGTANTRPADSFHTIRINFRHRHGHKHKR